ncbi:putative Poly(A)-specific ribonuclease PARN [Nannochloris sp. 'desiccata']|nr:putative Poly(A)-specific ribonuclease PARN [Chlorella desiccata (nom. nud.)]
MRQVQLSASLLIKQTDINFRTITVALAKPGLQTCAFKSHRQPSPTRSRSCFLGASKDVISPPSAEIDMEVTRHNFAKTLPLVNEALAECKFYAFDCEMTGLFVKNNHNNNGNNKAPSFLGDIEDRYEELLESSNAFTINQFGLSCFTFDDATSSWTAKTFNFYTFPHPFEDWECRFLSEAGSLQFLAQCHFDFNKWIYGGIPYMPSSLRDIKLKKANDSKEPRPDILPTKQSDIDFVENLIKTVRTWLNREENGCDADGGIERGSIYSGSEEDEEDKTPIINPEDKEVDVGDDDDLSRVKSTEEYLQLTSVNSYQRALQYQTLRNNGHFDAEDPPGFYVDRVENRYGRVALKLIRATSIRVAARQLEEKQKRIDAINTAASFCQVVELMRDSRKPAVGHNLSFDVAYTLHSFAKPLPPTWMEFKDRVKKWFPGGVYDTKYIASLYEFPFEDTVLGALYKSTQLATRIGKHMEEDAVVDQGAVEESIADRLFIAFKDTVDFKTFPQVDHADGFRRYVDASSGLTPVPGPVINPNTASTPEVDSTKSYAHEAGYDAYMTGSVFAVFLSLLQKRSTVVDEDDVVAGDTLSSYPLTAAAAAPILYSLEAVEEYCWRMNVSRSDMGYAALWGPDNVLPRNNILYLTRIDPTKYRHGGDVVKKLREVKELLDGAYIRVSVLGQDGTTALLELPKEVAENEEILQNVKMAVEKSVPGCRVKTFEDYRTVKAIQKAGMDDDYLMGNGDDGRATEGGVIGLPAKRPRTDSAQDKRRQQQEEEEKQIALQTAAESSRCSIM